MVETREEINLRFDLAELGLHRGYVVALGTARTEWQTAIRMLQDNHLAALAALDSPFTLYDQADPRWGNDRLGFGPTSIARYGCVITALAMAATHATGTSWTPPEMNDALKDNGGFVGTNRNLVVWRQVPSALLKFSWMAYSTWTPAPLTRIDAALDAGLYVLAQVDQNPSTVGLNEHWVLLREKTEKGYTFADSLGGEMCELPPKYCRADWNAARAIFKVVVYGPMAP